MKAGASSFKVVFKLGGKVTGSKSTKDRGEAELWRSGWIGYGILPYGVPSFGAPGICSKCGQGDLGNKINARVCAGCGWSFGLCKCTPMNEVPRCPACKRDLPVVAGYCPYCGTPLNSTKDDGPTRHLMFPGRRVNVSPTRVLATQGRPSSNMGRARLATVSGVYSRDAKARSWK
ncbi:MAG: zinc ribbon domain-containing protein [Nitrososphaerota archaeon]|nr:zinc ribbon domain-containing protein [Nitrososphaerota archaeon]